MDEIRRKLPGGVWNARKVLRILQTKEPYASFYGRTTQQAKVGENRVADIVTDIGAMDDQALDKLRNMYPHAFDHALFIRSVRSNQRAAARDQLKPNDR